MQKDSYSQQDFDEAMSFLQHGLDLHSDYGGKIFAVGRLTDEPKYDDDDNELYYSHSHVYAEISDTVIFDSLVDYSEFRDILPVARQTSITPVIGKNFDMLRDLLISHGNILPDYVLEAEASPLPYAAPNRTSPHSLKGTAILIRCSRITAQNLHFLTKNYTLKKLFSSTHRVFSSSACMTKF